MMTMRPIGQRLSAIEVAERALAENAALRELSQRSSRESKRSRKKPAMPVKTLAHRQNRRRLNGCRSSMPAR